MSMSIQSDVEILSVQAVEYYAQKHHLSEGTSLIFSVSIRFLKKS